MPSPPPLSRRLRVILSLLVLIHLAAVFAPPMAFQSRGPRGLSPSISKLLAPLAAYGQFLYLDRGYAFFAPDPGPSHLMRVEIGTVDADANGKSATNPTDKEEDEIHWYPNLNDQWPRLLYHRHFMLTEFLNDSYQPKLPADAARLVGPELPLDELKVWRLGRERYEMILGSMTHHLETKFGERAIQIDRVEHLLPDFVAYAANPVPLNDPAAYVVIEDIPISMDALLDVRPETLPPASPIGIDSSELAPSPDDAPYQTLKPVPLPDDRDSRIPSGEPSR